MGSAMSLDVSVAADITTVVTQEAEKENTHDKQFEDALRQEVLLVPEDIEDIHIQATPPTAIAETTNAYTDTNGNGPANYTCNGTAGKGKHWKRNLKKKQQQQQTTVVTHATERTIEQRREQVRPIVDKLTELQMNVSYPAIRELYKQISHFIKTGEDTKIKIAFPEFSRKIKGELSNAPYIPCWVKLEME